MANSENTDKRLAKSSNVFKAFQDSGFGQSECGFHQLVLANRFVKLQNLEKGPSSNPQGLGAQG